MRRSQLLRLALGLLVVSLPLSAAETKSGFFTTSDGVKLHYLEAGSGLPIVFVPGWTMPAWIWEPQIDGLSKDFRVIALDPRSQGQSDRTTEGHYVERRARDIKELVDHLKLEKPVLAGWSLGVAEVVGYVREFGADNVRGLVLVDGLLPDPEERDLGFAERMFGWLKQIQIDRPKQTEAFVRSMYKKPQPEEYLKKVTQAALSTPTNTAITLLANMMSFGDWRPAVSKLQIPVLYVITTPLQASGERLKKALPSARVETFTEAGHALFVDEPERFNALVGEFLSPKPEKTSASTAPRPTETGDPFYTDEARKANVSGTVKLQVEVDEQGVVRNVKVLKPLGHGLDEEAVKAVRRWKFTPATKDGRPVRVLLQIDIFFRPT